MYRSRRLFAICVWFPKTKIQNLLLGQRSGLVPADILPLAPRWICYADRPAVVHGSNIGKRGKIGLEYVGGILGDKMRKQSTAKYI